MNRNFTNDELEDFLKRSSDRLQMRPSDKVWKGISNNLNRRRRRFGWFAGSFLLATSLVGYFFSHNGQRISKPTAALTSNSAANSIAESKPLSFATTITTNSKKVTPSQNTTTTDLEQQTGKSIAKEPKGRNPFKVAYKRDAIQFASVDKEPSVMPPATVEETPAFTGTIVDSDPNPPVEEIQTTDLRKAETETQTIESVTNLYRRLSNKSKLSFQFFFTPTVSYRKLKENKPYMASVPLAVATPNYAALYDINDAVTHKPNIGLELGVAAKYAIATNVRLQGGLQFNMSRYDIRAFSNYNYQPAALAANSGGNRVRPTSYTNFSGNKADWLQNIYFQVSAPVGVEVKFGNNKNTQFGIATTVQPTYMLGDRVYLISSDYKTYVEVPWMMRRWNVNTALETFVAYSTGKLDWQVGPQVRYQLLSSFEGKYPVKEHLFDFGLKVGVSLNKKASSSD